MTQGLDVSFASSLNQLIADGESSTLEFKTSTGELRETMQTLCAFANAKGGRAIIGIKPGGEVIGQQVSDKTLRDVADARARFEPPLHVEMETIDVSPGRKAFVLSVENNKNSGPYTYDGRPYERIGSTTRRMPRERFDALILESLHPLHRWENAVDGTTLAEIDADETFRIVQIIQSIGRLTGPGSSDLTEMLDRLGVRQEGKIFRAAIVLFGKSFMPYYPQCELRMARFRGIDKAEFLDQRQVRGPAFKLLEEAEIFC